MILSKTGVSSAKKPLIKRPGKFPVTHYMGIIKMAAVFSKGSHFVRNVGSLNFDSTVNADELTINEFRFVCRKEEGCIGDVFRLSVGL